MGFHGIYLVALQAAKLGPACAVGHCHQEFIALRAAMVVHGFLPGWRKSRGENITGISNFNRKARVIVGFIGGRIRERRRPELPASWFRSDTLKAGERSRLAAAATQAAGNVRLKARGS
jgi:hypothetical protein